MRSLPARRTAAVALAAAASVVALAGPAFAHVTVNPGSAEQGGYTAVDFRVPNENDAAGTVKLEVNLPLDHPLASVRTQPLPGWTSTVEKAKLDKPIKVHGNDVNEAVAKITWTADAGVKVAPASSRSSGSRSARCRPTPTRWSSRPCRPTTTAMSSAGSTRPRTASRSRPSPPRC